MNTERSKTESRIRPADQILQLINPEVRIETTNCCNYACVMCPREKHTRPQGVMSFDLFSSLVDEVSLMRAEQITLTGFGEPFADPGLEEKIAYVTKKGLSSYLITNASLFQKKSQSSFSKEPLTKIQAALQAGLTELRVSFYGTSPEHYDRVMLKGDFNITKANLLNLLEQREQYGRTGVSPTRGIQTLLPEISIYFLELAENDYATAEFLEFTKELCDYVEVWKPHNFGDGRTYRINGTSSLKSCGRPKNGPLQIDWSGVVVPCCYDYNEAIPLGNVSTQTVEEVLRGKPYSRLRVIHENESFAEEPYCQSCDQLREHSDAIVVSTNPQHAGRSAEEIVQSPNTRANFILGV